MYECGCFRFFIRFPISNLLPALCTPKSEMFVGKKNCVFSIYFFSILLFHFSPIFSSFYCNMFALFFPFIFSVFMFCSSISLESTYEKNYLHIIQIRVPATDQTNLITLTIEIVWQIVWIMWNIEPEHLWDGLGVVI